MTVDGIPNSGDGLYYSRAMAEHAAQQMQAENRITKVEESQFHLGQWTVFATPLPETGSTPVENAQAATVDNTPAELQTTDRTNLLHTYRSLADAESAAQIFRAEGRQTKIEPSQLHKNQWVVYCTRLPENSSE
jgi:hypothetical protein